LISVRLDVRDFRGKFIQVETHSNQVIFVFYVSVGKTDAFKYGRRRAQSTANVHFAKKRFLKLNATQVNDLNYT